MGLDGQNQPDTLVHLFFSDSISFLGSFLSDPCNSICLFEYSGTRNDYFSQSYVVNIGQTRNSAGYGPVVFFNSAQIFLQFSGETFPDRNFFSKPLLKEAGTFFKYLSVFLARALVPFRKGVLERPIPAADRIKMNLSKSSLLVMYFQLWIPRSRTSPIRQKSADMAPIPEYESYTCPLIAPFHANNSIYSARLYCRLLSISFSFSDSIPSSRLKNLIRSSASSRRF